MKSVFTEYKTLWPQETLIELEPMLSRVPVLNLPEDKALLSKVMPHLVVLVVRNVKLVDIVALADMGFEHIVQIEREDFAQELLAASLMTLRPKAFLKNPVPFFLSGFASEKVLGDPDKHLIMRFIKQSEKNTLMDWLKAFLDRDPRTQTIRDLCLQAADEMITNALFNAPVRPSGKRAFKDLARNSEIELPTNKAATIFACFSEQRIVIGCEDAFGSLEKPLLMEHLRSMFKEERAVVTYSGGGAGLGFRYLLENAANFYVLVDQGKSTLIACGFMLKGLKSNLTSAKHVHLSFHSKDREK